MWQILPLLLLCATSGDSLKIGGGWRQELVIARQDGRIVLEDPWFISETVVATRGDDTLSLSSWQWIDSLNAFSATCPNISAGDSILVVWRSASVTDRSTYQYYSPFIADPDQSDTPDSGSVGRFSRPKTPLSEWSGIRRNGTIVRGVKFGSAGESGSTSGLHLEMSGRPSPDVEIQALIDDRNLGGSSGEGSTTLAEVDRMLISASTPRLSGSLGDLDIAWTEGEFARIERRLKGATFGANFKKRKLDVFAGGGNTRFATITLNGRSGDQGPYELLDRFGKADVTIVAGSEKVRLNGSRMKRGLDADYTIDYDRGTILFHPSLTILNDSRIDVEYEYSEETYSKLLLAGKGSAQNEFWRIGFLFAEEGRDGDNPLAFEWTPDSRQNVVAAGDNQSNLVTSGVTFVGDGKGDYVWRVNSEGDSTLFFSTPDSLGRPTGNLTVEFSIDSTGAYQRIYDPQWMIYTYYWVGLGNGRYSPSRYIPLPDRIRLGVGTIEFARPGFSTVIETAVSDNDLNTISPLDDDDNFGAAFDWRSRWASADSNLTANLKIRRKEAAFRSLSRTTPVDYQFHWGLAGHPVGQGESSVEAGVEGQAFEPLRLKGSVGYLELGSDFRSSRLGLEALMKTISFDGVLGWEHLSTENDVSKNISITDRLESSIQQEYRFLSPRLKARFERQSVEYQDSLAGGNALIQGEPGLGVKLPAGQQLDVDYLYRRDLAVASEKYIRASDTRSLKLGWDGRMNAAFWRSAFQRSLQTFADPAQKPVRSTSAAISTGIGNYRSPVRFSGDYRINTGNIRSELWTAAYVGEGNGGYRYEEGRYVADPDGDFELQQVVTEETELSSTVDFSGTLSWRTEKTSGDSGQAIYPFGISGGTTRFDANAVTYESDPWATFLLIRPAFLSDKVSSFRWDWRQEVTFLDSESPGDGRLTLERKESRDDGFSNGEERLAESASFRMRVRMAARTSLILTPFLNRARRWDAIPSRLRSNVGGTGAEIQLQQSAVSRQWESSLTVGIASRYDRISDISVFESRIQPLFIKRFGESGSGRVEAEWRRLDASSPFAGYDLLGGWFSGDNYSAGLNFDRRMGKNITLTASLRSRWRASRVPLHSGLVELTAAL